MHCPFCRSTDTRVLDSRVADDGCSIRRRRTCNAESGGCGKRFTTVELMQLTVVKRSGATEPFAREKAMSGVSKACKGRPVTEDQLACLGHEVEDALRADMRDARAPSPAARAQDYKLGGPPQERRYTCPSYELLASGARVDLPGFRPIEAYEAALANLAPELARRPDPESVNEVLAWAPYPLATAEVAAVCDREIADVRVELARTARFEPVGADGYWSL
jgi:transcriptional regulator NrdR